ncbi:MAG: nitroreductase family protein [Propionibacteriaceae bacterium]|jgi:nitroreductase|nr:nitroreductase family protein [Propionibacteriaceae bacterium]
MADTIEAIATRYSCRNFKSDPLPEASVQAIARAALQSPSARNRQPWHFSFVTDKTLIEEMDVVSMKTLAVTNPAAYDRTISRGGKLFYNAAGLVVISAQHIDGLVGSGLDVGIATATIVLAAKGLGIDSCVCALASAAGNGHETQPPYNRLGIPEGYEYVIAVLLGFAAGESVAPHTIEEGKLTFIR